MSERYSRLFTLEPDLYSKGAPIVISAGALLKDNLTGNIVAQLKLTSIDPKTIIAVKVRISPYDSAKRPLDDPFDFDYLDLSVRRDMEFGKNTPIPLPNSTARIFKAKVIEVTFSNCTVWNDKESDWSSIPSPQSIEDKNLLEQYRIRYGNMTKNLPLVHNGIWICSCGSINHLREQECHLCLNSLQKQLDCDMAELEADKEKRLAKEEELNNR